MAQDGNARDGDDPQRLLPKSFFSRRRALGRFSTHTNAFGSSELGFAAIKFYCIVYIAKQNGLPPPPRCARETRAHPQRLKQTTDGQQSAGQTVPAVSDLE